MATSAWLALPQQILLEVTGGRIFHDDPGELAKVRQILAWYPDDVWLWLMASQWHRIEERESFVGRTAELGDDLGSRLLAAHIAEDAMRLCFLQERCYAPYAKWLGTAFNRLTAAADVGAILHDVLAAVDFAGREDSLVRLYEALAGRHNALAITMPVAPTTELFQVGINDAVRPYRVLNAGRFAEACLEAIADERMRHLSLVGAIDQLIDPTDLLVHFTDWPQHLSTIYQRQLDPVIDLQDERPTA
jgi:hypothetical protein